MNPVTELSAIDFAALADTGWPTLERAGVAGWQVRTAGGVTKRANSAWSAGCAADASPDALAAVERAYRERALPPIFQLAGAEAAVRAALVGRGYRLVDETLVLAASLASLADQPRDIDIAITRAPDDDWLGAWWAVDGRGGAAELEIARQIVTGVPALYASLRVDGAVASVARLALVDTWGGLYCVATLPEFRRRGYGERVTRALLAAGAERGVTDAWLQVVARNDGALALYSRLGFAEVDRYEYLVGA
ncbi:GNAT family N-acetyltransferase [Gryllotalpicola daejeonensis]|uniref:GNAT family N-acetyltransferase n=1 Tax=Gryllotalpicola daejeonensis TaxID=993087 RepID=A0ABP7ZIK4_9MICO